MAERSRGMGRGLAAILTTRQSEDELEHPSGKRSHEHRLQNASLLQRGGECDKRVLLERPPRLVRIRNDQIEGQIAELQPILGPRGRQDGREAAAHAAGALSHVRPPPWRVRSKRRTPRSEGRDG